MSNQDMEEKDKKQALEVAGRTIKKRTPTQGYFLSQRMPGYQTCN